MASTIGVLILASIRLYREGLAQLLSRYEGFRIIGAWSYAGPDIAQLAPDVVLLDMALTESYETARQLRTVVPAIPVVAIGIAESDAEVLACAELGAAGYVTREASLDELVAAVKSTVRGELLCSPRTAGTLFRHLSTLAAQRDPSPRLTRLTRREYEIAALIREDLSNKEIASRLCIELATVKNHVHNLLDKLNVHRRADAARLIRSRSADR